MWLLDLGRTIQFWSEDQHSLFLLKIFVVSGHGVDARNGGLVQAKGHWWEKRKLTKLLAVYRVDDIGKWKDLKHMAGCVQGYLFNLETAQEAKVQASGKQNEISRVLTKQWPL